jgi:hypothetical protein
MNRVTGARRACIAISAVSLSLSAFLTAGTAEAAPTGTTLAGATLTTDSTSITGLELAHLTIALHLTDSGGVDPEPVEIEPGVSATCPCALLEADDAFVLNAVHQGMNVRAVRLSLVSGTPQDGMWAGTAAVGSPGHGHWQLRGVVAGTLRNSAEGASAWQDVDGSAYGAAVDIAGSNWPVLTATTPNASVPWPHSYTMRGQATYSDTHAPIGGLSLSVLLVWHGDWPLPSNLVQVTTDSDGNWALTTNSAGVVSLVMYDAEPVSQGESGAGVQFTSGFEFGPCCRWNPTLTTRRVGTTRYLDVHYGKDAKSYLQLQRWTSEGWRGVVTRTGSTSGTFRFSTHTAGRYRVRASDPPGVPYPFLRTHTSAAVRI